MTETLSFSVKETAVEIRKALRQTFPGVKFSLTMSRGTGYGWMSLGWTDGPTESEVRALTDLYRDSYFDGMTDSTHTIPPRLWAVPGHTEPVTIRYSCNGVNGSRSNSPEAETWAREQIAAHPGRWSRDEDQWMWGNDPDLGAVYRLLRVTSWRDGVPHMTDPYYAA